MQRTPPELTRNARDLRRIATAEECTLSAILKQQRPRFTRQLVIDRYIVDFACRSVRLAIELDGGHHADRTETRIERRTSKSMAGRCCASGTPTSART